MFTKIPGMALSAGDIRRIASQGLGQSRPAGDCLCRFGLRPPGRKISLSPDPAPGTRCGPPISPAAIHSQILPEEQNGLPTAWVAPDNRLLPKIDPNGDVCIVSALGRLKVALHIMPGLHPGVVLYRRGDWMNRDGGVNQLIAAGLTDIGLGAPFYDQYVRLENDGRTRI